MCWSNYPNKCGSMCWSNPWRPANRSKSLPSLTKTSLWKTTGIDIFPPFSQPSHAWSLYSSFGVKLITLLNPGEPRSWKTYRFQRCLHTPSAETLRVWLMNVGMFRPPRLLRKVVDSPSCCIFIFGRFPPPFRKRGKRYGKLETYSPESV